MKKPTQKPPQKPPKLNFQLITFQPRNFNTLLQAAKNGDLALVSAIRKKDNSPVALICAINHNSPTHSPITLTPIAELIQGNPYQLYQDPTETKDKRRRGNPYRNTKAH